MQIRSNTFAQPLRQPQQRASAQAQEGPQDGFQPSSSGENPRKIGTGLAKLGISTAIGYGLGSAASAGGFAGAVVGGLTGLITGTVIATPMGNGKGGDGLIYPVAGAAVGLVGGAVVGAFGGNVATAAGTVLGAGAGLTLASGNLFGR